MTTSQSNFNFIQSLAFSLSIGAMVTAIEAVLNLRSSMGLSQGEIISLLFKGLLLNVFFFLLIRILLFRHSRPYGLTTGFFIGLFLVESAVFPTEIQWSLSEWVYALVWVCFVCLFGLIGSAFDSALKGKGLLLTWPITLYGLWVAQGRVPDTAPIVETDALSLVLISIDGIEPHGFFDGQDMQALPTLSSFSKEGVFFENAYASTPYEQAALYAFLSQSHPIETGVDGPYQTGLNSNSNLSQALSAKGFETAAFVGSSFFDYETGMGAGFTRYDDRDPFRIYSLVKLGDRWTKPLSERRLRQAPSLTTRAIDWLKSSSGDRAFLWVHFSDLNGPFDLQIESQPQDSGLNLPSDWPQKHQYLQSKTLLQDAYLSAFKRIDTQIGMLIAELKSQKRYDRTLFVILGSAGAYGVNANAPFGHPLGLSEETLHVPLMIRNPRHVQPGTISCLTRVETMSSVLKSLLVPTQVKDFVMEGALRGGDCKHDPLLAVGPFVDKDDKEIYQERLHLPKALMLRDGSQEKCYEINANGHFKATPACDSRLSLIWTRMASQLKGTPLEPLSPQQSRDYSELGIE